MGDPAGLAALRGGRSDRHDHRPGNCPGQATHFILVRYPTGKAGTWCAFLCTGHARSVPLAEPLDQVAAAELADRREQYALALAGRPYRRAVPLQLSAAAAGAAGQGGGR